MPVLLDAATALSLDALLAELYTDGLEFQLEAESVPTIAGLGTLSGAGPTEIAFLANAQYAVQLADTHAAAVILTRAAADAATASSDCAPSYARVITEQPYLLYARVAQWFDQRRTAKREPRVHPTAVIGANVSLGAGVDIGPGVCVEDSVRIEDGVRIGAGCYIGAGSVIGRDSILYPRVTLYANVCLGERAIVHAGAVLGADGFGFAPDAMAAQRGERGRWVKIPQLGGLVLGDDVEIGANTTIDRGALESTVIGNGVKLDNQIMIAHNVHIGDHTAIAACVGIAGSTRIGARCVIGGAAMIAGHLTLADDVFISGGTVVGSSIPQAGRYTAVYPMLEHAEWQRNTAVVPQLSRLRRRVQALERQPK